MVPVGQLVLLVFCAASIVGFVLLLLRAAKKADLRHDLQCRIYLARRSSKVIFVAGSILLAAFTVSIGAVGTESGLFAGWGLVAMASLPLLFLVFYIYLAQLPFTYPVTSDDARRARRHAARRRPDLSST